MTLPTAPLSPTVAQRLICGGTAVDLECGDGDAAIELALAFPRARIFAFDRSAACIARARSRAAAAGVASRIRFAAIDWSAMPRYGFDLIAHFDLFFFGATRQQGADMPRARELDDWDDETTDLDVLPCGELVSRSTLDDELEELDSATG